MAKLSKVSVTEKSITVRVTGLDGTYSRSDRYVVFRKDGSPVSGQISISAYATQSSTYTYTGLKADTEYDLEAYIYYTSNGSLKYSSVSNSISTSSSGSSGGGSGDSGDDEEEDEVTVDPWEWDDYPDDFEALDEKQATTNFSYQTWNDLVDKVYEMRKAYDKRYSKNYGNWDSGEGLSRSNTKMSSSDKVLTAKRYNSLKNNVGAHPKWGGTGIPDVQGESTGNGDNPTVVSAQKHFIDLVEVINDIIADYLS